VDVTKILNTVNEYLLKIRIWRNIEPQEEELPMPIKSFQEVVRSRQSVRQFLSTPVKEEVIREILEDAQYTPSNCNTQPWNVHIVSGDKKDELSKALIRANEEGNHTPDFTFDMNAFYGQYSERKNAHGKAYYEAQGIAREDYEGRQQAATQNYNFFQCTPCCFLIYAFIWR